MPPSIPLATYRIQLTPNFGFDQAAALVPYLKALGISHLYASPFLKARTGSLHGYDVVDHNSFNPELGGEDAFRHLSAALATADIGLILDFVPNHMVARRPGMGTEVSLRCFVRYRLADPARASWRWRLDPCSRNVLRRSAGTR